MPDQVTSHAERSDGSELSNPDSFLPRLRKDERELNFLDVLSEYLPAFPKRLRDGDLVRLSRNGDSGGGSVQTTEPSDVQLGQAVGRVTNLIGIVEGSYDANDFKSDELRKSVEAVLETVEGVAEGAAISTLVAALLPEEASVFTAAVLAMAIKEGLAIALDRDSNATRMADGRSTAGEGSVVAALDILASVGTSALCKRLGISSKIVKSALKKIEVALFKHVVGDGTK